MSAHNAKLVGRAQEHREAGWSLSRTADLLGEEFGVRPATTTVLRWTDEKYAVRARAKDTVRARLRHRKQNPPRPDRRLSAELRLERMRELRLRSVSCRAIGQVAAVWWGDELSAGQVRRLLGELA